MKIALSDAAAALNGSGRLFVELFRHGSMSVELYRPEGRDLQQPHRQDELYFIAAGTGLFRSGGDLFPFQSGDILFVPAGVEHRFESFSEDFLVWVVFYGPDGGE